MIKVELMDGKTIFASGSRSEFYNEVFLDKDKLNADIKFITLFVYYLKKTLFGNYKMTGIDAELFNINVIKRVTELGDDNDWYEKNCID